MRGILLLLAIGLAYLAFQWLRRQPGRKQLQVVAVGVALTFVVLAATGRLHWLFALIAAAFPVLLRILSLLSYLPAMQRGLGSMGLGQGSAPSAGKRSAVDSKYLRMVLDHDTGAMSGTVLEGRYAGRELGGLSLDQLLELLAECAQDDEESATLLRAYLDRTHGPEWQQQERGASGAQQRRDGAMTRAQAFEVLGLEPGATDQEIREAHRRLMQRLHPDRGGSTFLAAQINYAKDLLLGEA